MKIGKVVMLAVIFCLSLAVPVLAQTYYANVILSNTTSSSYAMYPAVTPMNTEYLVANGYVNSTALDTRVLESGIEVPHMLADDKLLFATDLPASSSRALTFTTGNSLLSDFDIVLGEGGYITTGDSTNLEPEGNFSIKGRFYVDASTSANFTSKDSAITASHNGTTILANVTGAESVNTTVPSSGLYDIEVIGYNGSGTETLRPNADGLWTVITRKEPASSYGHWWYVDEVVADNATTCLANSPSDLSNYWYLDLFEIPSPSCGAVGDSISSITVYAVAVASNTPTQTNLDLSIRTHDTIYSGIDKTTTTSWATYSHQWTTNPSTSANWTWDEIEDLQIGMSIRKPYDSAYVYTYVTQVYTEIAYTSTLDIHIDGVLENSTPLSANVTNNSNDWLFMQGLSYADNISIAVNGTQVLLYEPITYISGTTMPDRAGAAQDGVITWGYNDTGVSAIVSSLTAYEETVGEELEAENPQAVGEISPPSGMYPTEEQMAGKLHFLYPTMKAIADAVDLPIQFFWWAGCALMTLVFMIIIARYIPNLWLVGLAGVVGLAMGFAQTLLPGLFIILGVIALIFALVMERTPSI